MELEFSNVTEEIDSGDYVILINQNGNNSYFFSTFSDHWVKCGLHI